jgi:acyl-CoA thioester hydrolase
VAEFNFSTEIRVRFAETDAAGIAHHTAFLVWFEAARVAYLTEFAGGYQALRETGVESPVVEMNVRYHSPAHFDEELRVHARCCELRGARFRFEYLVERDGERLAAGSSVHALVDNATLRPVRVPAWLGEAIQKAEQKGQLR